MVTTLPMLAPDGSLHHVPPQDVELCRARGFRLPHEPPPPLPPILMAHVSGLTMRVHPDEVATLEAGGFFVVEAS